MSDAPNLLGQGRDRGRGLWRTFVRLAGSNPHWRGALEIGLIGLVVMSFMGLGHWFLLPAGAGKPAVQQAQLGQSVADQELKELKKKAAAGDGQAQFDLGRKYHLGIGVPQDTKEALMWLEKSAGNGFPQAMFAIGLTYHLAQGVPRDMAKAAEWYRKGADLGLPQAQHSLGYLYEKGLGVARDYHQAAEWYRKAADQGSGSGQISLARLYREGYLDESDYVRAYYWATQAARQNHRGAHEFRDALARAMTPEQVAEGERLVRSGGRGLDEKIATPRPAPSSPAGAGTNRPGANHVVKLAFAWENEGDNLDGTVLMTGVGAGQGQLVVMLPSRNVACKGAWIAKADNADKTGLPDGTWTLACAGGLSATGHYLSSAPGRGTGAGVDNRGRKITFKTVE